MSKKTTGWIVVSSLIVLVGAITFFRGDLQRVWAAAQPRPQGFVQLAFDNPLKVPQTITPGKPYSFAFWAESHQPTTQHYKYQVFSQSDKGREQLSSGSITLAPGQRLEESLTVIVPQAQPRQKIVVTFPELNQTIHFWASEAQS